MQVRWLGPGTELPSWAEALDQAALGSTWGPLDEGEYLGVLSECAFVRWRLIPVVNEAELLRLAVSSEARRQGHARQLLSDSETKLASHGITELHLEVRVSNVAARTLYESAGWRFQGIRKAYYRDGEDAALYQRDL
jgi:ribosomal-protein-alanine N-acetyltransferase